MGKMGEQITVVILAIVGVAVLATLLSKNANTSNVLKAAGQGFNSILGAALSPVAGNAAINY